jgi:spore maturation protein B
VIIRARINRTDAYDAFLAGAEQGVQAGVRLIPSLMAMLLMIGMLESSGLLKYMIGLLMPVTKWLHLPEETAPVLLLRPFTGSGCIAALEQIHSSCGPDSRAARAAAVLMGSSETIFYTMTVYLGAAGLKKLPNVLPVSLISYLAGAIVCGLVV